MWLILTEPYDDTGTWLAEGLRPLAPCAVNHLTTHDFTRGARTSHIAERGEGWFQVTLENGTSIDSRALRGVVNRVCALPPGLAFRLQSPQRDHAESNFGLPLLHLLHGYTGPVLNRPTAQGISGDFRLDFEWAALARQVGLARADARSPWADLRAPGRAGRTENVNHGAATVSIAVIGDQVLALDCGETRLPSAVISCCRRLAALSRTTLLGLELLPAATDEWQFLRANPRVNLIPGGADALAAVARALSTAPSREADARPLVGRSRALAVPTQGAPV